MTRPQSLLDVPEAQRAPMTRDDTRAYVQMSFADEGGEDTPIARALDGLPAQPPAQVRLIIGRMRAGGDVLVRLPAIILVSCFCRSPGDCVLWAYTLVVLTQQLGRAVRVPDLAEAFPWGFPTEEGARLIWDAQKDSEGNRLDRPESWHATQGGA